MPRRRLSYGERRVFQDACAGSYDHETFRVAPFMSKRTIRIQDEGRRRRRRTNVCFLFILLINPRPESGSQFHKESTIKQEAQLSPRDRAMQTMGWFGAVRGHSGSSAMPPFDRAHTTSYTTLIETMRLSFTVFEI